MHIADDILTRAADGDIQSFEVIYKAISGFVYNVAFRIVNNREDAEEVTQEVFLKIHSKLKDFRFESSIKTWAYRITVNTAINFAKKVSKNKTVEYDETMDMHSVENDVKANMDKEEHNKAIEQLLNVINPDQRACVVLRNIEGLSYNQIAEALNININTVRTRLKRAREKMLEFRRKVQYGNV